MDWIDMEFQHNKWFKEALTHCSVDGERSYDRMEILGDAVIGMMATDIITKSFPDMDEGEVSQLRSACVNTKVLAEEARRIGLHKKLKVGDPSMSLTIKVMADVYEAVIGAAYRTGGMKLVMRKFGDRITHVIRKTQRAGNYYEPTVRLQSESVALGYGVPVYNVTEEGPAHDRRFVAEVTVGGAWVYKGRPARSMKGARRNAARAAYQDLLHRQLKQLIEKPA